MNDLRSRSIFQLLVFLLLISLPALGQQVEKIRGVTLTVSDIEKSKKFYRDILNFNISKEKQLSHPALNRLFGIDGKAVILKMTSLTIGKEQIKLIEFVHREGRPIPRSSKSNDLWFQHMAIVVNDMENAYDKLWSNRVSHVSTAPQTLPAYIPEAAGIKAFYFRDPDDHNLELIYFPEGKGDPKWQNKKEGLFMGIDHTAIAISQTQKSKKFYQGLLGLEVAGQSENYGKEQEHLNQVFGARLLITGMRANKGIGLEFLDYIAPPGGRLYPENSKVTDLWHWHTTFVVDDVEQMYQKLLKNNVEVISRGVVDLSSIALPYNKAFIARDPDGHAILFGEK